MSSLIQGYEYDIFISYRQKDNKHDGWVTEFVDNLKGELESTFKEEVSVYFDINSHDGLLETHDVDASLKEKLRCLIFIPIISRTYCDPRSFAWEHEFKAFVKEASKDQFGLKVKLPNGNVANRVLPVRIYDLDSDDIKLCESVLGGVLRSVEFIYKSAGINRPLLLKEENPQDNLNHTNYRDQINKVANSIKEIITALGQSGQVREEAPREIFQQKPVPRKSNKTKIITGSIIALAVIILGIVFIPNLFRSEDQPEKSIAVLPFENLSIDEDQIWFSEGITDVIINQLSKISGLRVLSRTSALKYKGNEGKESVLEIGKELGVNYIIEGTVQRQENEMRISVQLICVLNEGHIWSGLYDREWKDIFDVQSEIAQRIAGELKTILTPEEKKLIEKNQTENAEAYQLYLQGRYFWYRRTKEDLERSVEYFEKALAVDPDYALAYAGLADAYFIQAYWGWLPWDEGTTRSKELALKALEIDKDLAEAHTVLGAILNYKEWKWEEAQKELQLAIKLNPKFVTAHHYYSELQNILRHNSEARKHIDIALQLDPFLPVLHALSSGYYYDEGKLNKSLDECFVLHELDPEYNNRLAYWREFNIYYRLKDDNKALEALQNAFLPDTLKFRSAKEVYNKSGMNGILSWLIETELKKSNPSALALTYNFARLGSKEEALNWLEEAFKNHPANFLESVNRPDWEIIRSEPRFQELIKKMGLSDYQITK